MVSSDDDDGAGTRRPHPRMQVVAGSRTRGKSATAQDLKSSQSKGASRPTEVEVMRAGLMIMSTCLSVLVYLESCM